MIKSITYFEEKSIKIFEKLEDDFIKSPQHLAEYISGITKELYQLGLEMVKESLESMDEMVQESLYRRKTWVVESHTSKQLLTSLGTVTFRKTLFTDRETGKSEYLLDRILGFSPNQRISEDAEAALLEEAVRTSYARGSEKASLTGRVSRQTVKNKVHRLRFPEGMEKPEARKKAEYLYLDADEDHLSLQFREEKGDLTENENHQKNNGAIAKLVYVYEGIENEAPKGKRRRLIHPYYFCQVSQKEEENSVFWKGVNEYLKAHYELDKVKKIYVNADGGGWIKAGMKEIEGATHVLDEFHIEKYLRKIVSHRGKEGREEAIKQLRQAIAGQTREAFKNLVEEQKGYIKGGHGANRIDTAAEYLLSNWEAAKLRLKRKEGIVGSSTESHVSHVLSSRMSSRPMGWSRKGAGKMAQLRAYYLNGGDMLALVRYQKTPPEKKTGEEEERILSSTQVIQSEKNRHGELGKYMEAIRHSLPAQSRKAIAMKTHIWGL